MCVRGVQHGTPKQDEQTEASRCAVPGKPTGKGTQRYVFAPMCDVGSAVWCVSKKNNCYSRQLRKHKVRHV